MAGIFPNSGVPANQAAGSVDVPTTGCTELFHDTGRCTPRFDPLSANSMISEVLNVVESAGLPYNCAKLTNLSDAIDAFIGAVSPCTAPAATAPEIAALTGNEPVIVCIGGVAKAVQIDDLPLVSAADLAAMSPCGATAITPAELLALDAAPATGKVAVCIPDGAGTKIVGVGVDDLRGSGGGGAASYVTGVAATSADVTLTPLGSSSGSAGTVSATILTGGLYMFEVNHVNPQGASLGRLVYWGTVAAGAVFSATGNPTNGQATVSPAAGTGLFSGAADFVESFSAGGAVDNEAGPIDWTWGASSNVADLSLSVWRIS